MLRELRIRDLALIADAKLEFRSGFVVISGETGAGKSLLISAIDLLIGHKADAGIVRAGAAAAEVMGRFDIHDPDLRNCIQSVSGIVGSADSIEIVRRIPASGGKAVATANGSPVSLKTLQAIGTLLIDHVGQHQTRGLAEASTQTVMLDRFGDLTKHAGSFREQRSRYETARRRRIEAESAEAAQEAEKERIRIDLEELDRLSPSPGEPQALMAEAKRLSKADEIRRLTSVAYQAISESDTAIADQIAKIVRKLLPIANLSEDLTRAHESLSAVLAELDEISETLAQAGEAAQADPRRSDAIEKRLADYRRLARRFSVGEDELPAVREKLRSRLDQIESNDRERYDDRYLHEAFSASRKAGQELAEARRVAAARLSGAIDSRLRKLGMEAARVNVVVENVDWPEFDRPWPAAPEDPAPVRFLFRPNPGEPESPLERIASGGELSRLMLACMASLADSAATSSVLLDEIDSGVGGRLGSEIGSAIAELARHHQVICITHLPQIASQADQHLLVRKRTIQGRTATSVEDLVERDRRIDELAAMIRGRKADANTRIEAEAMLNHAAPDSGSRSQPVPVKPKSIRTRSAR